MEVFSRSADQAIAKDQMSFLETLAGQAAIAIENLHLFDGLQRSNMELAIAYDATIEGWSRAMDLRDKETEGHTKRVVDMTLKLAADFDFSGEMLMHIRHGALLHDIGKLGVPDNILLKPDKLTDEEWVLMKKHPTFAFEMLCPNSISKPGNQYSILPSRKMGWHGLSARPERRANSAGGTHLYRRGCLGCHYQ